MDTERIATNEFNSEIRSQIQNRMKQAVECSRRFLPEHELHAILTEDVVRRLVRNSLPTDNFHQDFRTICEEGRKVLAILVNHDREHLIKQFLEHNMLDSRLPLHESSFTDNKELDLPKDVGIRFAKDWQWPFIPVRFTFDNRLRLWKYQQSMIIPIINKEGVGEGAYGDVDCITIAARDEDVFPNLRLATQDQSHSLQLVNLAEEQGHGSDVTVVRKQLRSKKPKSRDLYLEEVRCLRLLNQKSHPNIVKLLYCYTHNETMNFIFPRFKMDLEALLKVLVGRPVACVGGPVACRPAAVRISFSLSFFSCRSVSR